MKRTATKKVIKKKAAQVVQTTQAAAPKQALPGMRLNAFSMDPWELTIVGLDTKDAESHPLYDDRVNLPLSENLVKNVISYGIIEPVVVRKNGEVVEVIDGRQRVRAAREATRRLAANGFEGVKVPVIAKRGEDHRMLGILISANEQREDDKPIARARKAARLMDMGRSEEEVAVAAGRSVQTVRMWLKILELIPEVQAAIDDGRISATDAVDKCYGKPREKQLAVITKPSKRARLGRPAGPSKATLRLLLSEMEEYTDNAGCHPQFLVALRYALGMITAEEAGVDRILPQKKRLRKNSQSVKEEQVS